MINIIKQIDDRIGFIWDRLDKEVNDQIFEQIKTQTKK